MTIPREPNRTKHVTLADVADLAGVTTATASRALSKPGRISIATEMKVRQAAEQLGYGAGRMPTITGTHRLAVIASDLADPFLLPLIRYMMRILDRQNFSSAIFDAAADTVRERILIESNLGLYDGMVLLNPMQSETRIARWAGSRPMVTYNRPVPATAGVETDAQMAVNDAVGMLHDMNHRRIVYACSNVDQWIVQRRRQWIGTATARYDSMRFVTVNMQNADQEYADLYRKVMADGPDAVFAGSDTLALSFIAQANQNGTRIPDDVSVISFDDSPLASCGVPPLASIRATPEYAAQQLVALLGSILRDPEHASHQHIRSNATFLLRPSLKRKNAPLSRKRISLALTDTTSVTDLTLLSSSTIEALPRIDEFMRQYPTIRITPVEGGSQTETMHRYIEYVRDNHNIPDLINIQYQYLPQFAANDLLLNFRNNTIERSWSRDFADQAWQDVHYAGGLYGIPGDLSQIVMFYRRDIFERHGLRIPTTWQEYHDIGVRLHDLDPSTTMGLLDISTSAPYGTFYRMSGARLWTTDAKHNTINFHFGTPQVQETARFIQQCIDDHVLHCDAQILARNYTYVPDISDGRFATIVHANWQARMLASTYRHDTGKWRIALAPTFEEKGRRTANIGGSLIAVSNRIPREKQAPALAFAHWFQASADAVRLRTRGSVSAAVPFLDAMKRNEDVDPFYGQNVQHILADALETVPDKWESLPIMTRLDTDFRFIVAPSLVPGGDSPTRLLDLQHSLAQYAVDHGYTVSEE